jgi:hypothetical protein
MAFIAAVLASTLRAWKRPAFLIPALVIALAAEVIVARLEWPLDPSGPIPTSRSITTFILVILGRAWFTLTLTMMALAALRGERVSLLRQWVHVIRALEVAVVCIALLVPIALGTLLLVVPGVYLLLLWSQAAIVILDDQARLFKSANWSASVTDGYRLHILGVWLIVWIVSALPPLAAASLEAAAADLEMPQAWLTWAAWGWNALTHTFGIALAAAMYLELSARAPWQPELERVRVGSGLYC